MSKTVLQEGDEGVRLMIRDAKQGPAKPDRTAEQARRAPVHVVYGGADLFQAATPRKLGQIALRSLDAFASDADAFAKVFGLSVKPPLIGGGSTSVAAAVRDRTRRKLGSEPVEDFRIDFEDGYGFRPDDEEDAAARRCAAELATAFNEGTIAEFSGFRIKSYTAETRKRGRRTLNIFLEHYLEHTNGRLPENHVVTLPKVTDKKEVATLCRDLKKLERAAGLKEGAIKIELMVEHPLALIDRKGNLALRGIVEAARDRCVAAHFGAYDYTASLGIAAPLQDVGHPACDFARQMMLAALYPLGIRLSDSVTTHMPVPVHRGDKLSRKQISENKAAVTTGWRVHFDNIRRSMANGFYQSWDLHPNQLVARYAAVYSFFLETASDQGARLRSFIDKAATATLTGHTFDDAASAMGIVNFFRQGLDCGALTEKDVERAAGVSIAGLRSGSLQTMVEASRTS